MTLRLGHLETATTLRSCISRKKGNLRGLLLCGLVFAAPALAQTQTASPNQGGLGTAQDCTKVSVDYANDPTLTVDEKIALMDRALYESLSRYDACMSAAANGGGGGSGGGGGMTGTEGGGEAQGANSVASSDMTGTQVSHQDAGDRGMAALNEADMEDDADVDSWQTTATDVADNGKVPEDIPPADNDTVLQAQIRQAAMNETDPELKAKLWDEYRRYKGLPTKNQ